ncbi:hypothetical protein MtrunA17_Chr1g0157041 [Medicago truncatula]|uniref:Transmembrane protein n=1 Tax=Medicago truncatula TaxID=3880 RepID=G7I8B9_MEDTR|nr:UPF0496 protein At1g20180 [Medicago truncatula]AES59800.1 transmembrane protein [Medicago truncatula]RHN77649.1 hypothetical protein MtrunA17_Chr1g0157041 [Medicago truncatula]
MTYSGWLCYLRRSGRSRKQCHKDDSLCRKSNVNEEYFEAFRTKSYIEICNKAKVQFEKTISTKRLSTSCSTSLPPICINLTEYLLEPRQEIITNMTQNFKVHHLLVDYFEASLEACRCCDTILEGIHATRLSYTRTKRFVKLSKRVINEPTKKDIYRELALFPSKLQNNPLSVISTMQFHDIRNRYMELLQKLTSKRRKIQRRLTLISVCKKVGGIALVTSHAAILIALLVVSFHSVVGLVAAPSIVGGLVGLFIKRIKNRTNCERLCEQLDAAAKGVFILINDLDTMSRMVKRLNDEVEHRKMVAQVCVKNVGSKCEILKRFMSEFSDQESRFLDELEELEEHVYLCFLTVNKSRRLVLQQITERSQH